MKCPNCNKEINDSFKFCPYCATPVVINKCPHCGSTNLPADSKFCPDCGGKIETVESDEDFNISGVVFKMIRVEGGTFTMGATPEMSEPYSDEKPTHQVTLSSYSIGETPVTQELWQAVMGSNPSYFKGDQRPVESVSWNDCQDFIKKLNAKTGKKFRLLTEAEWEFAARGGNKSKGYVYAGSNNINEVAWYEENSSKKGSSSPDYGIHPVKQKTPNELGVYDMSGNVWEWCQDWCDGYNKDAQTNPTGPASGSTRVCRGGCWLNDARACRLSYRSCDPPSETHFDLGFRLALSE